MEIGSSYGSQMMQQMQQMQHKGIEKFDANASGGLSVDEFASLQAKAAQRMGGAEGAQDIETAFATIDKDGSGEITSSEMQAHRQSMMQQQAEGTGQLQNLFSSDLLAQLLQLQESESESSSDQQKADSSTSTDWLDDIFNGDEENSDASAA